LQLSLTSGGASIPLDVFSSGDNGAHPAVLVLHGSGGMWNPMYHQYAQQFSRLGYTVFVLHYFARTATSWADDAAIERHFSEWMQTISDALDFIARQSGVDDGRIAVVGFSLGAFLALAVASQHARVKAVIDFFGGLPQQLASACTRMPPVLILHGDADERVPVRWAYELESLLARCGTAYEMKIYPGAGHKLNLPAMLDAGQRAVQFLKKHLG
jgi:dienelactone hydrolase